MPLHTFHYFCHLPFDIRREIYMLATPPRVVHVQEEAEEKQDFFARFNETVNIRLNPDLAYFAPNWRRMIPGPAKQRTLESVGVVSSQGGPQQPWEPSPSTPEIPLSWLLDKPEIASELIRLSFLYSLTPVPPLLHVWRESRRILISWGYMLVFETRTIGPMTWFNFERDVLFLESCWHDSEGAEYRDPFAYQDYLLAPCPWTILGQFHSKDLKRVKKLALGLSGPCLWQGSDFMLNLALVPAIQLFRNLDEVQIVQWEERNLRFWRNRGNNGTALHPWYTGSEIENAAEDLYSLPVEDIDCLLPLLSYFNGVRTDIPPSSCGDLGAMLKTHQENNATNLGYFEHLERQLERRLEEQRDKLRQQDLDLGTGLMTFSWQVPRVKAVHVIPSPMAVHLQQERQLAWDRFVKMKRNWNEIPTAKTITQRPARARPWNSAYSGEHLDMDSAQDVEFGPYHGIYVPSSKYQSVRQWWAEKGVIAAPSSEALF